MSLDRARRSVLLASLAFRSGRLDGAGVARFLSACAGDPARPVDELLRVAGGCDESAARGVADAAREVLARLRGDAGAAVASVPLDAPVRDAAAAVDHPDFRAVLAALTGVELEATEADSLGGVPGRDWADATIAGDDATCDEGFSPPSLGPVTTTVGGSTLVVAPDPERTVTGDDTEADSTGAPVRSAPPGEPTVSLDATAAGPGAETTLSQSVEAPPITMHALPDDPDATVGVSTGDEGLETAATGPTRALGARTEIDPLRGVTRSDAGHARAKVSRYRVVRSHARGGLGEVFVAVDGELNREVALKEIQGRHADDQISRARFVVEAEVTGGLEHPGIVPVYGLGEYADGRPYYAMRFVRGESLKDAIVRFHHPPEDRPAADAGARALELHKLLRRFVDVCNAMEYAHSRGVLHRDLKPANIMLGPFGETLVVDWGLAKPIDSGAGAGEGKGGNGSGAGPAPGLSAARSAGLSSDEGPGTGRLRPMSASGSMYAVLFGSTVGTPHYMSPEQAEGLIDLTPASDIYSLGATLYNLLTGSTPFTERTLGPLLAKVRKGEFPPPRQLNPAVHPALEAICLKAMALKPADRYPSARALAEDIEHWTADEPVDAYPEPWTVRAARWARRHRTLVTTAASLLVAAVFGLGTTAYLIAQEQARTEANFTLARQAVDVMLTRLGSVDLVDVPGAEGVRREMLEKARQFYLAFLGGRNGRRPSVRQGAGEAHVRAGEAEALLGRYDEAEANLKAGIGLLAPMAAIGGDGSVGYRRDLARAQHDYGVLLTRLGRYKEADDALRAAVDVRSKLAARAGATPEDRADEQESVYRLGALAARLPGNRDRARAAYDRAIGQTEAVARAAEANAAPGSPEARRDLARYRTNLANLVYWSEPSRAEAAYDQARAALAELHAEAPNVTAYGYGLARTLSNLGSLDVDLSRSSTLGPDARTAHLNAALDRFEKAIALLGGLAHDYPKVPEYRFELAEVRMNRARLSQDVPGMTRKRAERTEADLNAARDLFDALVKEYPGRPDYRLRAADVRVRLGLFQRQRAVLDRNEAAARGTSLDQSSRRAREVRADAEDRDARNQLRAAVDAVRAIPTTFSEYSTSLDYRLTLAQAIRYLGVVVQAQREEHPAGARTELDEALDTLEKPLEEAVGLCDSVLKDDPTKRDAVGAAIDCLKALYDARSDRGRYAGAAEVMRDLAAFLRAEPQPSPTALFAAGRHMARALTRAGDPALTARLAPDAIKALRDAVDHGFKDPAQFDVPDFEPLRSLKPFQDARAAAATAARPARG